MIRNKAYAALPIHSAEPTISSHASQIVLVGQLCVWYKSKASTIYFKTTGEFKQYI